MKGKVAVIVSVLLFSMVFVDTARAQDSPGVKVASIDYEINIYRQAKADLVVPLEYQFVYPEGSFYLKVSPVDAGDWIGLEYSTSAQADSKGIAGPFYIRDNIKEELNVTVNGDRVGSIKMGEKYTIEFVDFRGDVLASSPYYTRTSLPEGKEFYVKVTSKDGVVADATVGYRDPKSDDKKIIETKKTNSEGVAGPYTLWVSATTEFTFVAYKNKGNMGACEKIAQVRDTISTPMTPEELQSEIEEALPMPPQLTGNATQDVYAWLAWWYNNFVFYGKTTRLGYGDLFAIKNWTQIVRDLPQLISKFPKYWVDPVGAVVGTRYMVDVFRELFKLIPAIFSLCPLIIETAPKRMLSLYPSIWMRLPNMLKGINQAVIDTAILMLSVAPAFMEIMPEILSALPDAIPKAGDILLETAVICLQSIPAMVQAIPAIFLAIPAFLMLMFMATFIMLPEFVVRILPIEIPKILTRLFALWPMYTTGIAAAFMAGAPMMMYFEPGIIIPAIGRTVESIVDTAQNMMGALRRMPSELLGPALSGIGSSLSSINFAVGCIWMCVGCGCQFPLVLASVLVGVIILGIIGFFFVLPAVAFFGLGLLSIIPPFSWFVGGFSALWMLGAIILSVLMMFIYCGVTINELCILRPVGSIISSILKPTIDKLKTAVEETMHATAEVSGKAIESATGGGGIIDTIVPLLSSLGSFVAGAAGGAAATGAAAAVTPL